MDFNQEHAYFKAYCEKDYASILFRVLSDCALEDRCPFAINVFL